MQKSNVENLNDDALGNEWDELVLDDLDPEDKSEFAQVKDAVLLKRVQNTNCQWQIVQKATEKGAKRGRPKKRRAIKPRRRFQRNGLENVQTLGGMKNLPNDNASKGMKWKTKVQYKVKGKHLLISLPRCLRVSIIVRSVLGRKLAQVEQCELTVDLACE